MSCWIMRINVEDWWQDLTLRNTGGMRAGFEGSISASCICPTGDKAQVRLHGVAS
jgi:hypothetical protein